MKLENQVTSVELSNKLHQLGVTANSIFYREWAGAKPEEIEMWNYAEGDYCPDNVNCYTVAELGEMLPVKYHLPNHTYNGWNVFVETEQFHTDNEADARAKMLIYLLENKFITL